MSTKEMLQFLSDLENNNTLEWMRINKAYYLEAKQAFSAFLQQLIYTIAQRDSSVAALRAEDLLFRLNRDTRFSHDKSPYNASFRAHISPAGKLPVPAGYFICIKPSASLVGGGVFMDRFADMTTCIREHIASHAQRFQSIVGAPQFTENYTLLGTKLKNVPQGYDKNSPVAEYLKHKSWFIECPVGDSRISAQDTEWIAEQCLGMKPFNDFINEALKDFRMLER